MFLVRTAAADGIPRSTLGSERGVLKTTFCALLPDSAANDEIRNMLCREPWSVLLTPRYIGVSRLSCHPIHDETRVTESV